jgi:K(+)-stimulated pyrophosphate-energized sodium pump
LAPVVIGFGINYLALGGFLAAAIITSQLMAAFMNNAGGAWDNAKKYIEDGHIGGKGSEAHKAAVVGDTVGDPFKDTAGPAFNPLIKCMNLVSLLVLPTVITLRNNDAARYAIAAVALVIILAGVAYSKRQVASLAGPVGEPAAPEGGTPTDGGPVSQTPTLPVSGAPAPAVPANTGKASETPVARGPR